MALKQQQKAWASAFGSIIDLLHLQGQVNQIHPTWTPGNLHFVPLNTLLLSSKWVHKSLKMQGSIFGAIVPVFGYLLSAPESSPTFRCGNEHRGVPNTFLEALHSLQKLCHGIYLTSCSCLLWPIEQWTPVCEQAGSAKLAYSSRCSQAHLLATAGCEPSLPFLISLWGFTGSVSGQ